LGHAGGRSSRGAEWGVVGWTPKRGDDNKVGKDREKCDTCRAYGEREIK